MKLIYIFHIGRNKENISRSESFGIKYDIKALYNVFIGVTHIHEYIEYCLESRSEYHGIF